MATNKKSPASVRSIQESIRIFSDQAERCTAKYFPCPPHRFPVKQYSRVIEVLFFLQLPFQCRQTHHRKRKEYWKYPPVSFSVQDACARPAQEHLLLILPEVSIIPAERLP